MVQRTSVKGISRQGRPAQGVRVMNLREDDRVSAVALVMETSTDTNAAVQDELAETPAEQVEPTDQGSEATDQGSEQSEESSE
jgi:DNA gyrase subunit A